MGVTAWSSDRDIAQQQQPFNTLRKMSKGERQHHMVMMDPPTAPPAQKSNVMVVHKPFGAYPGLEFGSEPLQLPCWSCERQIMTDVTFDFKLSGWCWAIICCFVGSCLVSCLVGCLPGFKKFKHHCPLCRVRIGKGEPKHESKHIALIIFSTLLVMVLSGLFAYYYLIPIITTLSDLYGAY